MAAPIVTTRERWIEEGLRLLASTGPEGVKIEVVAKRLGVTKGGFYGQFQDRGDYVGAVLDEWERRVTDDVRARVTGEGGDVSRKLRKAGLLTFSEALLLPIELAVRDWARRDPDVAARVRRIDNARMSYLRELIGHRIADPVELEARCLLAYCLAIGRHLLAADDVDVTRSVALDRAMRLLESV